jgi:hypothetical protein
LIDLVGTGWKENQGDSVAAVHGILKKLAGDLTSSDELITLLVHELAADVQIHSTTTCKMI